MGFFATEDLPKRAPATMRGAFTGSIARRRGRRRLVLTVDTRGVSVV
jgi:hypothetical protein